MMVTSCEVAVTIRFRNTNQRNQLVGGIPTPLKNMKVSWDCDSKLHGKIIQMFQTTNQSNNCLHSLIVSMQLLKLFLTLVLA